MYITLNSHWTTCERTSQLKLCFSQAHWMELYCIINLESNTKNWEEEVEFNFKTRVDYFFCWLFLLSAMQCHLDEPKFVQSVMMSIYSADNILWCCQCQWLPFERPQHERTARWYQNRKRQMRQKIRKYIFKLLQSLNLSLFAECPFKGKLIEVCVWFWFWKI